MFWNKKPEPESPVVRPEPMVFSESMRSRRDLLATIKVDFSVVLEGEGLSGDVKTYRLVEVSK